ncbi:replication-relaxation family protein [Streptomyces sp. NPDC002073]
MTTTTAFTPSTADTRAHQALALIAQHRLVTTLQLHQMLAPHLPAKKMYNVIAPLRAHGLITHTVLGGSNRLQALYLTPAGAHTVRDWPELHGRAPAALTDAGASLRAAHTLSAVRAHVAFLTDARSRGDEYGPLDWVPEIAHRLPDTGGEEQVIADAVFHYTSGGSQRRQYRAFVEIDRATMSSERLARKLISYARFHDYTPQPIGRRQTVADQSAMFAWQRSYPRFPRILFILTGAPRPSLARRIEDVRQMTAQHSLVARFAAHVPLGAAILEDIENAGPSAAVWTPLTGPAEPRPWTAL